MKVNKITSIFLTICILFGTIPLSFSASATETLETVYSVDAVANNSLTADTKIVKGGRYCISTVMELEALAKIVNEEKNRCVGATFYLGNDIIINDGVFSMSEDGAVLYNNKPVEQAENLIGLESIGTGMGFAGFFDGNGHTISGLYSNGLFNKCSSARISNLKIINSYVTSSGIQALAAVAE